MNMAGPEPYPVNWKSESRKEMEAETQRPGDRISVSGDHARFGGFRYFIRTNEIGLITSFEGTVLEVFQGMYIDTFTEIAKLADWKLEKLGEPSEQERR